MLHANKFFNVDVIFRRWYHFGCVLILLSWTPLRCCQLWHPCFWHESFLPWEYLRGMSSWILSAPQIRHAVLALSLSLWMKSVVRSCGGLNCFSRNGIIMCSADHFHSSLSVAHRRSHPIHIVHHVDDHSHDQFWPGERCRGSSICEISFAGLHHRRHALLLKERAYIPQRLR